MTYIFLNFIIYPPGQACCRTRRHTRYMKRAQSVRDPLIGQERATPGPMHHGQAMRSPMRTEWIKSQGLEMQGLWSRANFEKV